MELQRGQETINHPLKSWTDETGKTWEWPTLAFMQKRGFVEVPPSPPTQQEIFAKAQAELTDSIQRHLDATAQTRNYDGILSLCTYVTSTDPLFAAEGQAGVVWRDACWRKGYEIMAAVLAGNRPIPTESELLAEMPEIGW